VTIWSSSAPQTVNRLHVLLTRLIDGGAPTHLSAEDAARLLRRVRPATASQVVLRAVAVDLVAEIPPPRRPHPRRG
jgi:hypothetical protein